MKQLDRYFFEQNGRFNVRFIYSQLLHFPEWAIPFPSAQELEALDPILNQKFTYFANGCHTYAFLSADGQYVIKFHHYPAPMRILSWMTHPLAHLRNGMTIKERSLAKLDYALQNYKNSFLDLKDESGLILVHNHRTDFLKKHVAVVDKMGSEYRIPLDEVTFILQKKADLIYPTLDKLWSIQDLQGAKQVITHVIQLIATCCQKGYIDEDPILRRNYGLLQDRAIHIDIGDMVRSKEVKEPSRMLAHVKEKTRGLRKRIQRNYPELLEHYTSEIETLSQAIEGPSPSPQTNTSI